MKRAVIVPAGDAGHSSAARSAAAFYALLGLLYIFFADGVYRQYYVYVWLGGNSPSVMSNTLAFLGSMLISWGLFAGGIVAAGRLFGISAAELGWRKPAERLTSHIFPGAFLGLVGYICNVWLVTGILVLLQQGTARAFYAFKLSFVSLSAVVPTLVSLVPMVNTNVIAPVMEELAFRGVIFTLLSRRFGARWAVIVASALFSLTHLTINKVFLSGHDQWWAVNQFAYHFIGGVLYNILFIRSRSLVAPVSAHIAYNFGAAFLSRALY